MKQLSLDSALTPQPRFTARELETHRDHSYYGQYPRVNCPVCRDRQNTPPSYPTSRCRGAGTIADQPEVIRQSPSFLAKATCPTCGKRVSATRPTKATPWHLIGAHN